MHVRFHAVCVKSPRFPIVHVTVKVVTTCVTCNPRLLILKLHFVYTYIYICIHTHTHTHTYIYIYGDMNPQDLVLTSVFPIVSVTVEKQSVGILVLFSYVGYTKTISG
jgi:hypothetical protein